MPDSAIPPIIRHATREDVSSILEMIHELALYEKEPSAVEATESSLLSTLSFAVSPNTHAQPRLSSLTPAQRSGEEEVLEPITDRRTARTLLLFEGDGNGGEGGRDVGARPVGMALYFFTYSTWKAAPGIYLEDLFVREEFRGKGYGKALLKKLAQLTKVQGGKRLEWKVLTWNKPSIDFYVSETIGAKPQDEWLGMRVDGEELVKLAKQ